jgi:hypothetical protein
VRHAAARAVTIGKNRYFNWAVRNAPRYRNPTDDELLQIEAALSRSGISIIDFAPSVADFERFRAQNFFDPDYHGGLAGGVWDEKLVEHWISAQLLGLEHFSPQDIYVDVAACGSPWVRTLRERLGLQAFAIDLVVDKAFRGQPYYRAENATQTPFRAASVKGASLHCAFEMFVRDDDTQLIDELARVLVPGGKAVIVPLYMHTHYCAYATPEYYGRQLADPAAKEYVRLDCSGVPSSRKYDAAVLTERILKRVHARGMTYRLLALRNQKQLGDGIYCHFVLEITR